MPAPERAAFCRLEHVVPWAIQGPHWEAEAIGEPRDDDGPRRCSHCDAELGDVRVLLVRHRGEHRIADGFCSVDHLRALGRRRRSLAVGGYASVAMVDPKSSVSTTASGS